MTPRDTRTRYVASRDVSGKTVLASGTVEDLLESVTFARCDRFESALQLARIMNISEGREA